MTFEEFAERIFNLPSGGFSTLENRFDRPYIYSLLNSATAKAKEAKFAITRSVHPDWLFPYYAEFNEAAQINDCHYKFKLPQLISLGATQVGIGFVGSLDCNCMYRVVRNRARFAQMQQHKAMQNRGNTLLLGNGYAELYGEAKELRIDGCWLDVTKLPNYNIEKDDYPIDGDLIVDVEMIIAKTNLNIIIPSPVDTTINAKDDSATTKR